MIDIKSDADATYGVLRDALQSYDDILTRFESNHVATNAVTVVISGNRPRANLAAEKVRHAAMDGRLADLDRTEPPSLIPWISDNWRNHFQWRGEGELTANEREKLREFVGRSHRTGRLLRFWNTPDNEPGWKALYDADVDLLNTDALAGMQSFLEARTR